MPLSTLQATLAQIISTVIGLVVGLGVLNSGDGQEIVVIAGIVIGAVVQVANAIIHHGVTTATGHDATPRK